MASERARACGTSSASSISGQIQHKCASLTPEMGIGGGIAAEYLRRGVTEKGTRPFAILWVGGGWVCMLVCRDVHMHLSE